MINLSIPGAASRILKDETGRSVTPGIPKDVLTPGRIASAFNSALGSHPLLMKIADVHSGQGFQ